jgi:excisionase family DNA binding protein
MSTDGAMRRTAGTSKLKAMIGPMEGLPMARSPPTRRSGSHKRAIEMIVPTRDGRRGLTFLSAADAMRCSAHQHADRNQHDGEGGDPSKPGTAGQVAERWQVPTGHVYRLAREGRIPAVRPGRYYRFRVDALERWELRDDRGAGGEQGA